MRPPHTHTHVIGCPWSFNSQSCSHRDPGNSDFPPSGLLPKVVHAGARTSAQGSRDPCSPPLVFVILGAAVVDPRGVADFYPLLGQSGESKLLTRATRCQKSPVVFS